MLTKEELNCLRYVKGLLIPRGRVLPQKLPRPHSVKTLPAFHATRRFTSVYNFNIIFPSTTTSCTRSPSFSSSNQNPPSAYTCYMPRLFHHLSTNHESLYYAANLFRSPYYSLLDPNIFLGTLFPNTLGLRSCLTVKRPSFTPIQNDKLNYCCI